MWRFIKATLEHGEWIVQLVSAVCVSNAKLVRHDNMHFVDVMKTLDLL